MRIVLSAITVIEPEHGLHRAETAEQAQKRRQYLDTAALHFGYTIGTRYLRHFEMIPNLSVAQL